MRKIVVAILFSLFPLYIFADANSIRIDTIYQDIKDLSARTKQALDNNDHPAALLKISIPRYSDAKFSGSMIVKVEHSKNDAIYWVYVAEGAKKIEVQHVDWGTFDIPLSDIEGNNTYVIKLIGPESNELKTKDVKFDITPSNAEIWIDESIKHPSSDGFITLALGEHNVRITADGYEESYEKKWIVSERTKEYKCSLRRGHKKITLSAAKKVDWYIDDAYVGNAKKISRELYFGTHKVEAIADRQRGECRIYVDKESNNTQKVDLSKNEYKTSSSKGSTSYTASSVSKPSKPVKAPSNYSYVLNDFYDMNGKIQYTWLYADGYIGTGWGITMSIFEWRFGMFEIAPAVFGFGGGFKSPDTTQSTKNTIDLSFLSQGRTGNPIDGWYYAPAARLYFPYGSAGNRYVAFAGGPIIKFGNHINKSPWFFAEFAWGGGSGVFNWRLFARYNGDASIGFAFKIGHPF